MLLKGLKKYIKQTKTDNAEKYHKISAGLRAEIESFIHDHYGETVREHRLMADIDRLIRGRETSFSERLLELIDYSGKTDAEIYKKANIDRRLFSKIRSNRFYRPAKNTAIALAIALELNLFDTRDLIGRAGYTLSHSITFDLIVEYFIQQGKYDIFEINEALYEFDQELLGV